MRGMLNVAVILPLQLAYARGILRGITRFAVPAQPWIFYPYENMQVNPTILRQFQGYTLAGAIVYLGGKRELQIVQKWKIPVVNVAAVADDSGIMRVGVDDALVGEMAARHFLERGYRHFAFFGNLRSDFARNRLKGFQRVLHAKGFHVETPPADLPPPWSWAIGDPRLRRWLLGLPRPVGIFGYTDNTSRLFATICRDAGVRIPEDMALVGVDNDELTCQMSYPPLSSVEQPLEQIGYKAAELLASMIDGKRPPTGPVLLPPVGMVTRQSSDIVAIHDAEVASAMQFIREHADQPIRVEDILDEVPINRRSLEKRFLAHVGHSILTEINRTHVERAKRLLINTRMQVGEVSERSGFNSPTRFGIVFSRLVGMTPNRFRKTFSAE